MPQYIACSQPRCPHPAVDRGRCQLHRQTTDERGYGWTHQQIREALRATLPAECGYGCGTVLQPGGEWDAAHVVDGQPQFGYVAACRRCNERAKADLTLRVRVGRLAKVIGGSNPPKVERAPDLRALLHTYDSAKSCSESQTPYPSAELGQPNESGKVGDDEHAPSFVVIG